MAERYSKPDRVKGEGGWLCRCGCGQLPIGRRTSFYSQECVHNYLIRSDGTYMRRMVRRRDKGVCAGCGMDCVGLWRQLQAACPYTVRRGVLEPKAGDKAMFKLLLVRAGMTEKQFQRRRRCYDVDHIVRVADGGGGCGLENLQTLCTRCHRDRTAEQNRKNRVRL